ncbi:MAG TPA: glycosyltransferase [Gemmatimonadaceae bacterium]
MSVVDELTATSAGAAVARRLLVSTLGSRVTNLAHDRFAPPLRPDAMLGVLDITEFFGETSGGVRTYLMEKAAYIERHPKLRQILVLPAGTDAVTEVDGVRCYRMRGPRVPTQHPYRFMLATRSNRRIVEHERPDVIEVGSPGLVPWIIRHPARRLGIPLVHFYHSDYPSLMGSGIARKLAARYARALDRLFVTTIAASSTVADDLRRAGIDRVVRIPLGVDPRCFNPARRARGMELRARLGIDGGPLVIFVGRFAREKELKVLLAAWPTIRARTGAQLLLVGEGPLRRPLLDSINRYAWSRSVRWFPFTADREQLAALLAAADLFVSPGTAETFGLAALEALASGTPVLSADRGGVAEQVTASGAGALFPAGRAAELASAAVTLLSADDDELRTRARAYATSEHDWDSVFDRIVNLYRVVCNR